MKKFRSLITWMSNQPIYLRLLLALLVCLVVMVFSISAIGTPHGKQPILFDHKVMVGKGINCVFCHSGAIRSETAVIPSTKLCMGCHKTNDKNDPEIAKLIDYYNQQKPIPWVKLNTLPRFVHFSHQVHVVAAAQNCENCHGDVSQMTVYKPIYKFNMGTCLECHNKQPNAQQINSCETCHQ